MDTLMILLWVVAAALFLVGAPLAFTGGTHLVLVAAVLVAGAALLIGQRRSRDRSGR